MDQSSTLKALYHNTEINVTHRIIMNNSLTEGQLDKLKAIGIHSYKAGQKLAMIAKECKCSLEKLSIALKRLQKEKPKGHKRLSSRIIK